MASASSDPDNIRGGDARIVYELKSLVVMGQCYDVVDRGRRTACRYN